jgi:small subunit ribosomal protein S15
MYAIVAPMLTAKKKLNIIKKHRINDEDTGSPEVQVAILTRKINDLAAHLKKNHKDNHSRRGLLQMVANRHTHMRYLKKKSEKRYNKLAKELGIK